MTALVVGLAQFFIRTYTDIPINTTTHIITGFITGSLGFSLGLWYVRKTKQITDIFKTKADEKFQDSVEDLEYRDRYEHETWDELIDCFNKGNKYTKMLEQKLRQAYPDKISANEWVPIKLLHHWFVTMDICQKKR